MQQPSIKQNTLGETALKQAGGSHNAAHTHTHTHTHTHAHTHTQVSIRQLIKIKSASLCYGHYDGYRGSSTGQSQSTQQTSGKIPFLGVITV